MNITAALGSAHVSAKRASVREGGGEKEERKRGVERCRGRDGERRARREGAREGTSRKRGAVANMIRGE